MAGCTEPRDEAESQSVSETLSDQPAASPSAALPQAARPTPAAKTDDVMVDDEHSLPSIYVALAGDGMVTTRESGTIPVVVSNDSAAELPVELFASVTAVDGTFQRASVGRLAVPGHGHVTYPVSVQSLPARLGGGVSSIQFLATYTEKGRTLRQPAEVVVQGWSADLSEGWIGPRHTSRAIGEKAFASLAGKANRAVPSDDRGKRDLVRDLSSRAVWDEQDTGGTAPGGSPNVNGRGGGRKRRNAEVIALPFEGATPPAEAPELVVPQTRGFVPPLTIPTFTVCLNWNNTDGYRDDDGANATTYTQGTTPAAGLDVTLTYTGLWGSLQTARRYLGVDGCTTLSFSTAMGGIPASFNLYATSRFGTPGDTPNATGAASNAYFELVPAAGQSLGFATKNPITGAYYTGRTFTMPTGIASRIGGVVSRMITMPDGLPPIAEWQTIAPATPPVHWSDAFDLPANASCGWYVVQGYGTVKAEAAAGEGGACFGVLLQGASTPGQYVPGLIPGDPLLGFSGHFTSVTFERTTIGHELGHVLQGRTTGLLAGGYPPLAALNDGTDPAGLCDCTHVVSGNSKHCLQNRMAYPPAFNEGFAHYFSARVMNEERTGVTGAGTCRFPYYKDVQYSATSIVAPPVSVNCAIPASVKNGTPTGWQRTNCNKPLSGTTTTVSQDGIEWDFLTFLWSLTSGKPATTTAPYYSVPTNGITFGDVQAVIRAACNGGVATTARCYSSSINWNGLKLGASNRWGTTSPRFSRFSDNGRTHSVDGSL